MATAHGVMVAGRGERGKMRERARGMGWRDYSLPRCCRGGSMGAADGGRSQENKGPAVMQRYAILHERG